MLLRGLGAILFRSRQLHHFGKISTRSSLLRGFKKNLTNNLQYVFGLNSCNCSFRLWSLYKVFTSWRSELKEILETRYNK